MLIDFSVQNFRSIGKAVTLSSEANASDERLPENVISEAKPNPLVKTVVIYGANAAGKSNFIKALDFMRTSVRRTPSDVKPNQETGTTPFKFDRAIANQPSVFSISFLREGSRYDYSFSATSERIIEEELVAYPRGLPQRWYARKWRPNENDYIYRYSRTHFKVRREIEKLVPHNVLFLPVAASYGTSSLRPVYDFFDLQLRVVSLGSYTLPGSTPSFSASILDQAPGDKVLKSFIRNADLGIEDVLVTKKPFEIPEGLAHIFDPGFIQTFMAEASSAPNYEVRFVHRGRTKAKQDRTLELAEESAGTQKFFELAGFVVAALALRKTLVIDEIDSSLHPLLLRFILESFHKRRSGDLGAQLVCATHDTSILDQTLLRRDQVYFAEKRGDGSTDLYPLTDFKPRPDEALGKGYLAGRYGAIPVFQGDIWD